MFMIQRIVARHNKLILEGFWRTRKKHLNYPAGASSSHAKVPCRWRNALWENGIDVFRYCDAVVGRTCFMSHDRMKGPNA